MIQLDYKIGRGYLIFVTAKQDIINTLYEKGITDRYGFLIKPAPDTPYQIHDLFPHETIKISKAVNKFFKVYRKILEIDIESYQPPGIKLYPHQIENIRRGLLLKKIINADETGLGKTISTIGLINVLYGMKRKTNESWLQNLLIITPATLIQKWINDFNHYSYIELQKLDDLASKTPAEIREKFNSIKYKIISIDTLKRYHMYVPFIYDALVIDEVHGIKNRTTQRFSSVSNIDASYKIFMSATPLINSPEELHYISKILNPDLLGSLYSFEEEFYNIDMSELPNGTVIRNITSVKTETLPKLQHIVGSFITRHTWSDVDFDITTSINNRYGTMLESQSDIYNLIKRKYRNKHGLEVITYLQEICDSPHLLKQKLRIYNFSDNELYESWKTEDLTNNLIPSLLQDHNQVVIFTKYRRYSDYLYNILKDEYRSAEITGHVRQKTRDRILDDFRNAKYDILVVDDALSYGHDLQSATALINMELPLSPGVYDQRIGRIKRVGQNNNVVIYNYITKNSIEEYIYSLLQDKREYFNLIVDDTKIIQEVLFEEFNNNS